MILRRQKSEPDALDVAERTLDNASKAIAVGTEMADLIRRLFAERDRLAASLAAAEAERDALALRVGERDLRIAEVEAALEPFARASSSFTHSSRSDGILARPWWAGKDFILPCIGVEQLRAAARALAEPRK